jgi:hypothetical protein
MVAFDYENKKHIISKPFITTNDIEKDFEFMQDFFKGIKGKIVEYS